jgi:hypothetical protein
LAVKKDFNDDYLVIHNSMVFEFEFKWNQKHAKRLPTTFTNAYNSIDQCITNENFREFVHPSEFATDLI